ncbi:uncharacterized protein LOC109717059 [Ananas comosus]|uniref:Uncharacterized protein LOC109717059 n=1 Tax=Ananas comosus TaxID=4615 RepID=A0A6P5FPT2_ANACO|nr:uncharacterized protein LOC109717059 [Ananas comosus]
MPRLATVLAVLLILVLVKTSSGQSLGAENEIKPADAAIKALSRKAFIEVQDYDYGGANSRHDPRRGKPGNGGKNP